MTLKETTALLNARADTTIRNIYLNHGAPDSILGIRVGDMKEIQKLTKRDQKLATELFHTLIPDYQYFAALIGNGAELTASELNDWAEKAVWHGVAEYSIPWMTCDSQEAFQLGLKWINIPQELMQVAGWNTLSCLATLKSDNELDLSTYSDLLQKIPQILPLAENRVKYSLNGFVIAVGSSIEPLFNLAREVAMEIGSVEVFLGNTSCKVPNALQYLLKVKDAGKIGKKKNKVRC